MKRQVTQIPGGVPSAAILLHHDVATNRRAIKTDATYTQDAPMNSCIVPIVVEPMWQFLRATIDQYVDGREVRLHAIYIIIMW